MKRFLFFCVLLGCVAQCAYATEKSPNIVFILIDDLGWKDVGYNGSCYYETPNIDKLARGGVVFTNAYAPAANCAPSRACIMSGQATPRHGIYTVGTSERGKSKDRKLIPIANTTVLADSIITLAETLQHAGYKTASIGKWHLGDNPCTQGFDVNIAGTHAGSPKSYFSPYRNANLTDGAEGEYLTDRLTSEAIQFIRNQVKDESGQPFFLYLPYYTVHTPLQGRSDLVAKYRQKEACEGQNHAVYAAMVECADQNVGRLMTSIGQLGIAENTVIIFFSDNGGIPRFSSQHPLRAGKGSYYEGGIREPMIMSWANHFPAGKTIDTPVSGLDFYPTLMELAGVASTSEAVLDGESLVSLITKNKTLLREELFWHFPIYLEAYDPKKDEAQDSLFRTRPGSAMRSGDWKLIEYFEDGKLELYNLGTDLGERNNLAEEMPEKAAELHRKLIQWRRETNAPVPMKLNPDYEPK